MEPQDQKHTFHRRFRDKSEAIRQEIETLDSRANDTAVGDLLARLTALSNDVKDAAPNIPTYDQRICADTLKRLQEQVQSKRAPKSKFSFKNKNSHVASSTLPEIKASIDSTIPNDRPPASFDAQEMPAELQRFLSETRENRPAPFPAVPAISITSLNSVFLAMPSYVKESTSSRAYITSLQGCVIDLWFPTQPSSGQPLPSLHATNIIDSLLLCGHVSGPVHITSLKRSKIIVACQQLRMHDCVDCEIYLHCGSRPIIEGCDGISFAPLPELFQTPSTPATNNQWSQIDDFNWLKGPEEPSPHWKILPEEQRLNDSACQSMRAVSESVIAKGSILGSKGQLSNIIRSANMAGS